MKVWATQAEAVDVEPDLPEGAAELVQPSIGEIGPHNVEMLEPYPEDHRGDLHRYVSSGPQVEV